MAQCNFPWEQDSMVLQSDKDINMFEQPPISNQEVEVSSRNGSPMDNISINELQGKLFSANEFSPQNSSNHFQQWIPSMTEAVNLNLPVDLSSDEIRLCGSSQNIFGNFRQQPNSAEDGHRSDIFFEGSNYDTILAESEYKEIVPQQKSHVTSASNLNSSTGASSVTMEFGHDKDSIKHDMGMADSRSDCSDQIEDDDDVNVGRRPGRRNQCKNLMAERKRRKKLNERLYQLRALVPKITKMDKASILGDAIQFVKDLQKQAKDLQDELEERSDRDNANNNGSVETLNHNGVNHGTNPNMDEAINGLQMGVMEKGIGASSNTGMADPNHDLAIKHERTQQMEVQVKVAPIDGNEFFLKVFCEHKRGGFARLMEALCSLGLEVTDANITTFRGLVLNNFTVEKKDSEMIQAEQVRESLLELTSMSEPFQVPMMGGDLDYQPPHNHSHQHHYHH